MVATPLHKLQVTYTAYIVRRRPWEDLGWEREAITYYYKTSFDLKPSTFALQVSYFHNRYVATQ